jgi:hypothetical protein
MGVSDGKVRFLKFVVGPREVFGGENGMNADSHSLISCLDICNLDRRLQHDEDNAPLRA